MNIFLEVDNFYSPFTKGESWTISLLFGVKFFNLNYSYIVNTLKKVVRYKIGLLFNSFYVLYFSLKKQYANCKNYSSMLEVHEVKRLSLPHSLWGRFFFFF